MGSDRGGGVKKKQMQKKEKEKEKVEKKGREGRIEKWET